MGKKNKRMKVVRHPKLFIALHWLIVTEMLILLLTGFSVSEGAAFVPIPRGIARSLHVVVGLMWGATIIFFIYYFVMSGEYRWFGVSRITYGFDFFVEEIRAFLRGERVHEPVKYDPEKGDYIEKLVPTEVLAWWGWFLLWVVVGVSGLALLFPGALNIVHRLCHFIVADYPKAAASTRAVHFLGAVLVIVLALIHFYAALVFGMWKSIFLGTREEPVVEST
ncbi:MAG TPA: cytochrome b/b6 domain-containing protein [Chloroflexi bacterium]|nr:cytochrome b/b6 domain-containing protein [Chloroflexota bacterium]